MLCNRFILVVALLLTGTLLAKSSPLDTFRLANEALKNGATDDAIHMYEGLAGNGFASADLHYNLGTAYIQKSQWASARVHLERAKYLAPLRKDILKNLNFVRDQVEDYYAFPRYPLVGTVEGIRAVLGRFAAPVLFMSTFIILIGVIMLYRNHPSRIRRIALTTAASCFVLTIPVFLAHGALERQHSRMLITNLESGLSEVPEEQASIVEHLAAGVKLRIEEDFGEWLRVSTASGQQGWIQRNATQALL